MSRTECSFTQLCDKDKSFKVSRLHIHLQMQHPAGKQALFTTDTHTGFAQDDRWEKTQRSAISRASLRQDSDSFTSPWLRRRSWPKQIFSTVTALQNATWVSNCFKEVGSLIASCILSTTYRELWHALSQPQCCSVLHSHKWTTPMWLGMTNAFFSYLFADQHTWQCVEIFFPFRGSKIQHVPLQANPH